jgi:hypothetical protein
MQAGNNRFAKAGDLGFYDSKVSIFNRLFGFYIQISVINIANGFNRWSEHIALSR